MTIKGKAILKHGTKGGSGSGNWGHSGRAGKLGGSIPGKGGAGSAPTVAEEKPKLGEGQGSIYKQAQQIAGKTIGDVPLGVPLDVHTLRLGTEFANSQILQQHVDRRQSFKIWPSGRAELVDSGNKVRTNITPVKVDGKNMLSVTHEVNPTGNKWIPSIVKEYKSKTEYDALRIAMIDHASLVRSANAKH